jgi:hypothetical protein
MQSLPICTDPPLVPIIRQDTLDPFPTEILDLLLAIRRATVPEILENNCLNPVLPDSAQAPIRPILQRELLQNVRPARSPNHSADDTLAFLTSASDVSRLLAVHTRDCSLYFPAVGGSASGASAHSMRDEQRNNAQAN